MSSPLAYDLRGDGPTTVFLHGLTFDRATWAPVVDRLVPGARCLSVDLPGHGATGGAAASMPEVAARVHDLVEELALGAPVVVGHSLGAAIAGLYAAHYPVAGAVNVEGSVDVRPFATLVQRLADQLRGPGFARAFDLFHQSMELDRIPHPVREIVLSAQNVRQDVVIGYWAAALDQTPDAMQAEVDRALETIDRPYLAVFGHRLDEPERARMRTRIRHLQLEVWPDRGHFPHLLDLDRFSDLLRTFIDSCWHPSPRPRRDAA